MKKRIFFLLFLLIPVCLLVWFGFKAQTNEQLATQQQYQNLAHSQLKLIDEKIANYFTQLESSLVVKSHQLLIKSPQLNIKSPQLTIKNPQLKNESLKQKSSSQSEKPSENNNYAHKIRQFLKYSPYILNIYIFDKTQKTIYPSLAQKLSSQEQEFVSKIQVISRNQSLFKIQQELEAVHKQKNLTQADTQTENNRIQAVSKKLSLFNRSSQFETKTATLEHGWIAWYLERNLHHLFWFKDKQERIYLLYLDRIRILSELIALLPESALPTDNNKAHRDISIRLTDSNNELVYEWGAYQTNDNKSISMMLSYPLSSWKLNWYAKALSDNSYKQKWSLLIIAILASLLLMILMFIIYRDYNREIKQAQQRVNFVSQVSHELKTPLTNIRMYAELLEAKMDSEAETEQSKSKHFLDVIINESQRLSRLIENVLSFAKVQKATLKINRTKGIIDECIDNVLLSFSPILAQKNLSVQFNRNAGNTVLFDSQLLEQILNNLLSNIEKYAAQGKQIDINTIQNQNQTKIEIRDYGPGIADNEQKKIFNPFYRSSSKLTEGVSGTGIGLTISQQLAILHGGSLSYKSVPEGACFVMQLDTPSENKSLQQKISEENK